MWDHIVFLCEGRAEELGLADPTCADEATIAYVDTCPNSGGAVTGGEETGDGGAETGGEDPPKLDELDLTQEVELESGTYVGVTSTNLGGVLGFQNGDIVTEVSGQTTATYQDLIDAVAILLSANSATVELTRGTSTTTLYDQRGV